MSDQPVLKLTKVARRIGERTIIDDVNLSIATGEFVSVVGPSGCGKSTLLNIIGGFTDYRDYEGEVLLEGQRSTHSDCDKGIVFQQSVLYPWLNVLDNIAYGLILRDTSFFDQIFRIPSYRAAWSAARDMARVYLEKMCLKPGDAGKMVYEISGGMQQRVDIASALILRPKLLLMDEPFSGLDPQTRAVLQRLLRKVNATEPTTVLFVTHDLEEAVFLSDRVLVLSQYHDQGPGARIVLDQKIPYANVEDPSEQPGFQELVAKIRSAGFSADDRRTLSVVESLPTPGAVAAAAAALPPPAG